MWDSTISKEGIMKEVETLWKADSIWIHGHWEHFVEVAFQCSVSEVVVGLMRVQTWDDLEKADGTDYAPIPKAEGKLSIGPHVRGKAGTNPECAGCGHRWMRHIEGVCNVRKCNCCLFEYPKPNPTPPEPLAQSQSDSEGVATPDTSPLFCVTCGRILTEADESCPVCWPPESQDPRIADVFKRLDNPDCLGDTIRVAGHSEDVC